MRLCDCVFFFFSTVGNRYGLSSRETLNVFARWWLSFQTRCLLFHTNFFFSQTHTILTMRIFIINFENIFKYAYSYFPSGEKSNRIPCVHAGPRCRFVGRFPIRKRTVNLSNPPVFGCDDTDRYRKRCVLSKSCLTFDVNIFSNVQTLTCCVRDV